MADFDYNAAAELFPTRRRLPRREPFKYKRFLRAAAAIRFAIEDLPPDALSARSSKSTKSDMAVTISAVCTKAPAIRWLAALYGNDRQND